MSHQYRYTGDVPTVFISLQKDGETWMPSSGDVIEVEEAISHPLLEEVVAAPAEASANATKKKPTEPAEPVQQESPVTVDAQEEN
jgi:hypothetical protein